MCIRDRDEEIGDQQRQIEAVEGIKAEEGLVEEMRAKIMADTAWRDQCKMPNYVVGTQRKLLRKSKHLRTHFPKYSIKLSS